jgi:hypothetical protein
MPELRSARCALARHHETVAQRVAGLLRQARRAPIPAPRADPPGVLSYVDLLLSTFQPPRAPLMWPRYARELDAAASGDASALEMAAPAANSSSLLQSDDFGGDPVPGPPGQRACQCVAQRHPAPDARRQAVGTRPGLVELGSLRGTLASACHRALHALSSACADKWRVRYLVNLVTPPPGTVCGTRLPF